jgi:hypothetical protein
MGRLAEAHTELSIAIELCRTLAMPYWLIQAKAAFTKVE